MSLTSTPSTAEGGSSASTHRDDDVRARVDAVAAAIDADAVDFIVGSTTVTWGVKGHGDGQRRGVTGDGERPIIVAPQPLVRLSAVIRAVPANPPGKYFDSIVMGWGPEPSPEAGPVGFVHAMIIVVGPLTESNAPAEVARIPALRPAHPARLSACTLSIHTAIGQDRVGNILRASLAEVTAGGRRRLPSLNRPACPQHPLG